MVKLLKCSLLVLFFFGSGLNLQAQTVSGIVFNSQDETPIPGVNISVKGNSQIGTSTDSQGNFSLGVPTLNDTLIISFVGFQTREIPIQGRTNLQITLQSRTVSGEEIVVTAFGVEREQRSLSYSTQQVSTEELTEARETNVINSLQGKVAGLSITNSGSGVGSHSKVNLRGNRSISGSNEPLYVVDGVPTRGHPETLSPDNITDINVLKGANAAALYGSRAKNGVIIVETEIGQKESVDVSWNNTFMLSKPIMNFDLQNTYGQGVGGSYEPSSTYSWGPIMEGQTVSHWSNDPNSPDQISLTPQPNNVSDWFETGYNLASNLNVSTGSEHTTVAFSYTHTNAEGTVPKNAMKRHNVSVRINSELTEDLTLDSKVAFMTQNIDGSINDNPHHTQAIYTIPRSMKTEHMENYEYFDEEEVRRQNFWDPNHNSLKNPYWVSNRMNTSRADNRIMAMTSLSRNFTESLSLQARASYDGNFSESNLKWYHDTYGDAPFGLYQVSEANGYEFNGDVSLSYIRDITEALNIGTSLGGVLRKERNSGIISSTGPALTVPNLFTLSNTQQPENNEIVGSPKDVQSIYAYTNVGWNNAIYLNLTGRNDWSSTLPEENRSYFYPSVGMSFILSDLISEIPDVISYAKLNASWAKVGSDTSPYQLQRAVTIIQGGSTGFMDLSNTLPANNLKPERTESYEIGFDLRFLDGRLGLESTAYKENTTNQLFSINLPVGSGASSIFTNGGNVENKGIELLLRSTPIQNNEFVWDLNFNFGINENTVLKIHDERPRIRSGPFVIEQGEPWGNIHGTGFLRDDQGRVVVQDNGMPKFTPGEDVKLANYQSDWDGSISSTISYNNLGISFLIDHKQGGSKLSGMDAGLSGAGISPITLQGRDGGLIFGDNFFSNETAVKEDGTPNNQAVNAEQFWRAMQSGHYTVEEAFIHDATNTRLREVSISYFLPQSIVSRLAVSNIKFSLVGRNLFYIYRASEYIDPSIGNGTGLGARAGGDEEYNRLTERSFGANVKIDF